MEQKRNRRKYTDIAYVKTKILFLTLFKKKLNIS
jgi:hypothetical protein